MRTYRDGNGLSLLKKGKTGLVHAIFSRLGLILLLLALQVLALFGAFQWRYGAVYRLYGALPAGQPPGPHG